MLELADQEKNHDSWTIYSFTDVAECSILFSGIYICTGGIPALIESSAAAKAVKGVSSEGFITTVQPQARAGPT